MSAALSHAGAFGLLASLIATLAAEALGTPALSWLAWAGLGLYLLDAWMHLGAKGRGFISAAIACAVLTVAVLDRPGSALADGLARSAFIATLFTALGMLREAAQTSAMVRRCGMFLAAQPPGRRYAALTGGAHVFSIILNFGSVGLLGTLVGRALDGDKSARGRLRERRMMTAIHRGFATILAWSPLTVSLAVVLTALPGTSWNSIAPWCAASALGMTLIGWGLDRTIRPPQQLSSPTAPETPAPEGSWRLALPIVGLVGLVFVAGFALEEVLQVHLVSGVMMATPVIATLWLAVQERHAAATLIRMHRHVTTGFAAYRLELAILTSAAFIGSLIGNLLPADTVAAAIAAMPLPAWGLVAALAWVIVATGQVGLSPVLSASAIAGALPPPEALGLSPAVIAVALTGGWALCAASSPFGAASLIIGQMTGVGPVTAGARWNGAFALVGLIALTAWVGVVAALTG